ncbi:MAG TPA: lipid-A-disaccharide synthase [Burkholderiaceae bacterium]
MIAFVAGESSGDLLAAPVVEALRARSPGLQCAGIAGDRMIAAGCEPWHHVRELSVRGYAEVLAELPRLWRLRRSVGRRLSRGHCAALVGVDSPDFNLALETRVRAAGVPTVHYVSPSIWAWRAGRIDRIRRAADRVLLVFPFEQRIYDEAGIAATYVGHPLASTIPLVPDRAGARRRLGLAADGTLIALLPGSRRAEVEHLGPVFLGAARRLQEGLPAARFAVPVADPGLRNGLQESLLRWPEVAAATTLFDGRSHDCLEASDGAVVASGTATLEAALYKRPMVIAYRMPALSAWIMRRIGGYLPWVGLPNILAGETLVPELLQERAQAGAIADALLRQLEDAAAVARLAERFTAIHESLRRDTPALAADAIFETMRRAPPARGAGDAR